jgi:acyl-CoA synthetase (AMP-forming)/AMP-acid ligase II
MTDTAEVVTFADLEARSNQGAHLFRSLGLRAGDCIALYMENTARYLEICWAAQRSALYYTCIASHLTAPEVGYILGDCGARVLVTSSGKAAVAGALRPALPRHLECFMVDGTAPGYRSWEEAATAQPTSRIADESEGHDFLYSSGTTGRPKGVRIPLSGLPLGEDRRYHERVETLAGNPRERDLLYSPAPLYHAAPLRFCMTMHRVGAGCVLPKRFDAETSLRLIEAYRCSHSLWVPTMFVRLLKLPPEVRRRYDLSSLRVAIHGAAPCPVEVKARMIEWLGPVLLEYYGATEGNGLCCIASDEWLAHRGSVGRAVLGEVHILDEQEGEVPAGEIGGIYFAEGYEFEYYNDPEKTAQSRSRQGWTTLGDIGYVDREGYLYLTDRKAHTIITGGVNVYPQEVENRLITHPAVLDVAVFGVPDEDLGEAVKAVVQPLDMAGAGPHLEAALIAYCREELSPIKCPRSIDFEASLPREANGKLYKRLLKDRYWGKGESRIV